MIFYILQNDHHNKSSYHLSLWKVIIILLTVFSMLYSRSLWLTLQLEVYILYLLYLFIHPPFHIFPFWQLIVCTLYLWIFFCSVFCSLVLFFDFMYKWKYLVFVFICLTCFIWYNILQVCHSSEMARFHSLWWLIFHCIVALHIYLHIVNLNMFVVFFFFNFCFFPWSWFLVS